MLQEQCSDHKHRRLEVVPRPGRLGTALLSLLCDAFSGDVLWTANETCRVICVSDACDDALCPCFYAFLMSPLLGTTTLNNYYKRHLPHRAVKIRMV